MRIFLSYARSDDCPFVRRLATALKEHGLTVWFDEWSMPSRALTFMEEIRRAIDEADRLVVVMGSAALESIYVRSEWQYALARAKAVTPVLRTVGYDALPAELSGFHCPDSRVSRPEQDAISEIARVLAEPVPELGPNYGTPSLPPHFRPRPEDLSRLHAAVLAGEREPLVVTEWQRVTAATGMGGVGKSVLASALARSTRIRRVFTDGVLWFDARTTPHPEALVDSMVNALGRLRCPGAATARDSQIRDSMELQVLLRNRRCLLVVDNVSDVTQIEPIVRSLDTTGRLLLTTRIANICPGATVVPVGGLTEQEASNLLADWLGREPPASLVRRLHAKTEGLPFALALCGAVSAAGTSIEEVADRLEATDLAFLEQQFPEYPYPSLLPCLDVSMQALGMRAAAHVERFRELAVFAPAAVVPQRLVEMLWQKRSGLSHVQCARVLAVLRDMSLIHFDRDAISLHQLIHDYLRALIPDLEGLHRLILDLYREQTGSDLTRGPRDGYYHPFLAYHLLGAGRRDALYELLVSTPDWMRLKRSEQTTQGSFLADLQLAIDSLENPLPEERWPTVARLYAARHLAQKGPRSYGEKILRAMVFLGHDKQALELARANIDSNTRLTQLLVIAHELQIVRREYGAVFAEALELPNVEPDPRSRRAMRWALVEGCLRLDALDKAFELWRKLHEEGGEAVALVAQTLAVRLAMSGATSQARAIAATLLPDDAQYINFLSAAPSGSHKDAQRLIASFPESWRRTAARSFLVARLIAMGSYRRATRLARSIEDPISRIGSLIGIPRRQCIDAALRDARAQAEPVQRLIGLISCADALAFHEATARGGGWRNRIASLLTQSSTRRAVSSASIAQEAELVVPSIEQLHRAMCLGFLARSALRRGDRDRCTALLDELADTLRVDAEAEHKAELAHLLGELGGEHRASAERVLTEAMLDAEAQHDSKQAKRAMSRLLPQLARCGRFALALSCAESLEYELRSEALENLASACAETGRVDCIEELRKRGLMDAHSLEVHFVRSLARNGESARAQSLIGELPEHRRPAALASVAISWSKRGNIREAGAIVDTLQNDRRNDFLVVSASCEIAQNAAAQSEVEAWLTRAQNAIPTDNAFDCAHAQALLGRSLASLRPESALPMFEKAVAAAREVSDENSLHFLSAPPSFEALRFVAERMIEAGFVDRSLDVARSLHDRAEPMWRTLESWLIAKAAARLVANNQLRRVDALFAEAIASAHASEDSLFSSWRTGALLGVAQHLAEARRLQAAFRTLSDAQPGFDPFMAGLANWNLERPQTWIDIVAGTAKVFGWSHPDWAIFAELLEQSG